MEMLDILILPFFILISGMIIYLLFIIKNKDTIDKGGNENLKNKLNEVSNDINKIEIDLASVTAPINELNKFLGGSVKAGRLGEWSLESIVKDIMPEKSYKFQDQINPETRDLVDCAITTSDGLIIPIDSKFYSGLYENYQIASKKDDQRAVLKDIKNQTLKDAKEISKKYLLQNKTTNYAVLYMASEKIINLVDKIDGLRQECLTNHKILIFGPNTLAAFLDTVRVGHHYLRLNETAAKVAKVVQEIQKEFSNFDSSTESVIRRLDLALKDVQQLQTRVNVLGNRLEKGAETLDDE
tara:strand:+ start:422 stop:1312 length:891 start_codon:yes stop_codon:yes gene_type:complete